MTAAAVVAAELPTLGCLAARILAHARTRGAEVRVRPAASHDVLWLAHQLADFAEFYGTQQSLYPDEKTARYLLAELIDAQPFFIADVDVGLDSRWPVGFIGGALAPHPYNPAIRVLSEMFWWVIPEYRQTRAGLLLLEAFIAHGEAHAEWIHFTLEAKSPVNERTLTKRGFALYERAYLREVSR
jgi:hypothetical protein